MPPSKDSRICILGAGIFGLSTAYHLSLRSYTNIHLYDTNPYQSTSYEFKNGAVGASSDENKIIRASYADRRMYQDLAFEAMEGWENLNQLLEGMREEGEELPGGLEGVEKLWWKCGYARLNSKKGGGLEKGEILTQGNFPERFKHTQYQLSDPGDLERAEKDGIGDSKLDPLGRKSKGLEVDGVLDMTGGFVLAAKACTFFLHLCRLQSPNITLHLGGKQNTFASLVYALNGKSRVVGFKTQDELTHPSDFLILATGAWTPSLFPPSSHILETTSGTVLAFHLPPPLSDKYNSETIPVWDWNMGEGYTPPHQRTKSEEGGGIYALPCLPRTTPSVFKLAFRGAKWTHHPPSSNPSENDPPNGDDEKHEPISTPLLPPSGARHKIPMEALQALHSFARTNIPELLRLEPEYVRLCWYTDSVDNGFLVDHVPVRALSSHGKGEREEETREKDTGLFICTGGSGHGFKFLPVLGSKVVDMIEGVENADVRAAWGWEGKEDKRRESAAREWNGLEEGVGGWRNLERQEMVGREGWRELSTG